MEQNRQFDRISTMAGPSWYATPSAEALRSLADDVLIDSLLVHVADERQSAADIVEHLLEIDRRGLAIDRGYPSLFVYCRQALGYSEQAAYLRIRAARAALNFPEIIAQLRAGQLHLEAVARLSAHLTEENAPGLLEAAAGATKREVLALVAPFQTDRSIQRDIVIPLAPPVEPAERDKLPEIVAALRQRFHFTADNELLGLVERLRSLLRHKFPSGRLEEIFKEAAQALLDRIDPERQRVPRSRQQRQTPSRIVPRAVKAEVYKRDGGRCAYVAADGHRCRSVEALEYDHIIAWAEGGRSDTADNIRLLCRAHNLWLGRKRFGEYRRKKDK